MITFKIWTDEESERVEVKADSRDVLVWEKTSRTKETYRDILTEFSLAKFYRLCHIAAKRQGLFDGKLDEFERTYLIDVPTMGGSLGGAVEEDDDANDPSPAEVSIET